MKEKKVYVVDILGSHDDIDTDEQFINVAVKQGGVYTLEGFQKAFNNEEINSSVTYIRIL